MSREIESLMAGELLDEEAQVTLVQLCRVCQVPTEVIMALVDEGVVEPIAEAAVDNEPTQWRFRAVSVSRVRCAIRLEQDLGVNTAGVALALDLLDELEGLRSRLRTRSVYEEK